MSAAVRRATRQLCIGPGMKDAEHSFVGHESVATLKQGREHFPIDSDIDPSADPETTAVRRCEEVLSPRRSFHIGWSESEGDRWATADDFKGAERLLPAAEIRMTPGGRFPGFGKREAQPPQSRKDRPLEHRRHGEPPWRAKRPCRLSRNLIQAIVHPGELFFGEASNSHVGENRPRVTGVGCVDHAPPDADEFTTAGAGQQDLRGGRS
jgi:hypothetical protein